MCKRSDTERGELPSSTNLIASNFSSNVLLRIWTVRVVSNFLGSLHTCPSDPLIDTHRNETSCHWSNCCCNDRCIAYHVVDKGKEAVCLLTYRTNKVWCKRKRYNEVNSKRCGVEYQILRYLLIVWWIVCHKTFSDQNYSFAFKLYMYDYSVRNGKRSIHIAIITNPHFLSSFIHLLVIFLVLTRSNVIHPFLIVQVPTNSFFNAFLKLKAWFPS